MVIYYVMELRQNLVRSISSGTLFLFSVSRAQVSLYFRFSHYFYGANNFVRCCFGVLLSSQTDFVVQYVYITGIDALVVLFPGFIL